MTIYLLIIIMLLNRMGGDYYLSLCCLMVLEGLMTCVVWLANV
jgi:hypothetical protein